MIATDCAEAERKGRWAQIDDIRTAEFSEDLEAMKGAIAALEKGMTGFLQTSAGDVSRSVAAPALAALAVTTSSAGCFTGGEPACFAAARARRVADYTASEASRVEQEDQAACLENQV